MYELSCSSDQIPFSVINLRIRISGSFCHQASISACVRYRSGSSPAVECGSRRSVSVSIKTGPLPLVAQARASLAAK